MSQKTNFQIKKILTFVAKFLVSFLLVAWLIVKINWHDVLVNTQKISLSQIAIYIAVLLVGMTISSYKWLILSEFKGFKGTLTQFFQLYLTGSFINNFMPSFIGGDTYKAYMIGKSEKKYAAAASTVIIDRITGFFGAMILSLFFGILNWKNTISHPVLWILLLGIFAGLCSLFIFEKATKYSFGKKLTKLIPAKILEFIKILHEYYLNKKLFTRSMLLALLFCMVGLAAQNFVMFWALGIKVGILNYLSVIFLISIVSAAPISINNIGVQEWAYVTFFGMFGVSSSAVISISIVIRILQMIVSFTALPMYLRRKKLEA